MGKCSPRKNCRERCWASRCSWEGEDAGPRLLLLRCLLKACCGDIALQELQQQAIDRPLGRSFLLRMERLQSWLDGGCSESATASSKKFVVVPWSLWQLDPRKWSLRSRRRREIRQSALKRRGRDDQRRKDDAIESHGLKWGVRK